MLCQVGSREAVSSPLQHCHAFQCCTMSYHRLKFSVLAFTTTRSIWERSAFIGWYSLLPMHVKVWGLLFTRSLMILISVFCTLCMYICEQTSQASTCWQGFIQSLIAVTLWSIFPVQAVGMAHLSRPFFHNCFRLSGLSRTCRTITPVTSVFGSIQHRKMSSVAGYEYIITSRPEPHVLLIQLNRPKALNALCSPLFKELNQALKGADKDDTVGAMVLTGSERAFAG